MLCHPICMFVMSFRNALIAVALVTCLASGFAEEPVTRADFYVQSDPGVRVFVREVTASTHKAKAAPVLLIHGARVPGIASFDLPVEGGSLATELARDGHTVFVMDVRGYGRSTRGPEFSQPPNTHDPLVRSNEAVADIDAVVREIRKRRPGTKPVLLGWATGGHWAGYYASLHSNLLSGVIMLNTIYGVDAPQPMVGRGSDLEDPKHSGKFNREAVGAYRCNTATSLTGGWDRSIPEENKAEWRDPTVVAAYVKEAMASDPEGEKRNPPCFRSPSGAMEDTFYSAIGKQFWDASLITVPVLIIAGERDFWSRKEDRDALRERLVHSPEVKVIVVPNATHFMFLDRPEHGRGDFLTAVRDFLKEKDR